MARIAGELGMLQALAGSAEVQGDDDPLPFAQARLRKRGGEWYVSSFRRFVKRGVCAANRLGIIFRL
ncbi:hypothetical protein A1507_07120 [Methylomonas koyamae]|uniref:Uncharacterized protein n=1 Tax=Methylomonas koyamae TaxID=702114 RepID=A0A177NN02_9GAMM|nr:hypothetical protein A1507_07120 [Methylomonas koyamae]